MGRNTQSQKFADLIYSNPEFREDVTIIRRRFGIPDEGYKNERGAKDFFHKFSEDSLNITQSSIYITQVQKLQSEYYAARIGRKIYKLKIRELESKVPQFQMDEAINKLSFRHKISRHWDYVLLVHIITGERHWAGGCVSGIYTVGDGPRNEIRVTIDANCTLEDLKTIWPTVQEFQKRLYDYRGKKLRKSKNLERDSLVVELALKGLGAKDIQKEIGKRGFKSIGYEYVSDIIKRFKIKTGALRELS